MGERIVLSQREGRSDHQHMFAFRQTAERRKAVSAGQCQTVRARDRRLPIVVYEHTGVDCVRQRLPHRVARRAEQHRTRISGNAALVKQAAHQGGGNFVHRRKSFRFMGLRRPVIGYRFIIHQRPVKCISTFR